MSLRDAHKGGSLIVTGVQGPEVRGSLRTVTGGVARPSGKGLVAVQRATAAAPVVSRTANIGFVIDATISRSGTWDQAQSIQRTMFDSVGMMNMRLVHFGGGDITANPWTKNSDEIGKKMSEVICRGGVTQILGSFQEFLQDDPSVQASCIILVGDSYEEGSPEEVARMLKSRGIAVYAFHEGGDSDAEEKFKQIATLTNGVFAKFGPDLPLKDLCEGVALKTFGGDSALSRLKNATARQLLAGPRAG